METIEEETGRGRRWPRFLAWIASLLVLSVISAAGYYLARQADPAGGPSGSGPAKPLGPAAPPLQGTDYLALSWRDLGPKLVETGAIDRAKLEARYSGHPGLPYLRLVLDGQAPTAAQPLNHDTADVLLDLLWAFGLANRNLVLDAGPLSARLDRRGSFASTGGFGFSVGPAVSHLSAHPLLPLNPEQQAKVESLARQIYRPCCGNPTSFPDCNHGMAMLGLLELMAAEGADSDAMTRAALAVNMRWFEGHYQDVAAYLELQGRRFQDVPALELLGESYSSARAAAALRQALPARKTGSGSSC